MAEPTFGLSFWSFSAGALRWFFRRAGLLCLGLLTACATSPDYPKRIAPSTLGHVAVIATGGLPDIHLEGFSGGRMAGFSNGLNMTFASCMQLMGRGQCVNSGCGALVLFLLGTCSTLGVVGGVAGALNTDADHARQLAEDRIDRVLTTASAQTALRDRVIQVARQKGLRLSMLELSDSAGNVRQDYQSLGLVGIDTVLELELTSVGTEDLGNNAPSRLYMKAKGRLVSVSDNQLLAEDEYVEYGSRLSAWEWQANDGKAVLEGFEKSYERLAQRLVVRYFER